MINQILKLGSRSLEEGIRHRPLIKAQPRPNRVHYYISLKNINKRKRI